MAKIVIELPDEDYIKIKNQHALKNEQLFNLTQSVYQAIANGTEVKQGHWIWMVDESPATPVSPYELNWAGWACDHCRKQPDDDSNWDDWDNPPKYKYCPNCGTRMVSK